MTPDDYQRMREDIGMDTSLDRHTLPPPTIGQRALGWLFLFIIGALLLLVAVSAWLFIRK